MNFSDETNKMMDAAKEAAKIALKYFDGEKDIRHKGKTDLVTIADIECEKKIKEMLMSEFPQHGFMGEETDQVKEGSTYWVVDPIDGTNNFASCYPIFCHSIALVKDGKPIKGVVYDPIRKEMYVTEKGKGAYLNGKQIKVTDKRNLIDCLVGMGFPYASGVKREKTLASTKNLVGNCLGIRRTGSAAIDLCYLARGLTGAVFYYELKPWDVAAAMLLVEEAGGKITDINGNDVDIFANNYAVSNSLLHTEFLSCLEAFP